MPSRSRYARAAAFVAAAVLVLALLLPSGAKALVYNALPAGWSPPAVTLGLQKRVVGATTVESGAPFQYRLLYNCVSTTQDCQNVVITDVLPAELSGASGDVTLSSNAQTASAVYNPGTRTATWTLVSPLAAGSSGELLITVRFPNGSTPNGTTTVNSSTITGSNATAPVTATAPTVTATATVEATLSKTKLSGVLTGENIVYRVRTVVSNGSTGALDLNNVVLTDALQAGATFVAASNGGTYDAGTNTVTWPSFNTSGGANVDRTLTVRYDEPTFASGQSVTNNASLTGTPVGQAAPITRTDAVTFTLAAPTCAAGGVTLASITPNEASVGFTTGFRATVRNTGNIPINGYAFTQTIPAQVDATRLYYRGDPAYPVRVRYQTNLDASFRPTPGGPYTNSSSVLVSALGLGAGEYVTAVQYDITGAIPVGYNQNNYGFDGTVLAIDRNGNAVTTSTSITTSAVSGFSCATGGTGGGPGGSGTGGGGGNGGAGTGITPTPGGMATSGNVPVVPQTAYLDLNKTATSGSDVMPGGTVTHRLRVRNQTYATNDLVNPVVSDLIDGRYTYVAGSASPAPLEVVPNYNGSGKTLVRWALSATLAAGQFADITFNTTVALNQAPATIPNTYFLTNADNGRTRGTGTPDVNDLDRDGNTTETVYGSNTANVTVRAVVTAESRKWVKGSLDTAYNRFPDVGQTVPGGLADYRLVVFNTGNVGLTNIKIVDILPFVGDTGVLDPSPRQSQWRPNLIGPVAAPAGVTVSYSTEQNPCRTDLGVSGPAGCTGPVWSTTPPADITSVQSLRFEFGAMTIASRDSVELKWSMRAPVGAPANIVAWNSFGFAADRADGQGSLLPSEPIKVGIRVNASVPADYGDFVWEDLNANGVQDPGEIGINGVRVELTNVGPDGVYGTGDDYPATDNNGNQLPFTITGNDFNGNPGYYLFPFLQPGTYVAKVLPPAGYEISPRNAGGDDAKDSDIDPATGLIAPRTLAAGDFDPTNDAGLYRRTSLGDFFWHDLNGNGVQDASEPGIGGATVTLYNAAGVASGTTTTAANGSYTFDNLLPEHLLGRLLEPARRLRLHRQRRRRRRHQGLRRRPHDGPHACARRQQRRPQPDLRRRCLHARPPRRLRLHRRERQRHPGRR